TAWKRRWSIALVSVEKRPQHSGVLVRQCYCRHIRPTTKLEPGSPHRARPALPLDPVEGRAGTVNQQRAQVAIAALADPQQHRAPTAGAMAWHQSEIGRQFAAALE